MSPLRHSDDLALQIAKTYNIDWQILALSSNAYQAFIALMVFLFAHMNAERRLFFPIYLSYKNDSQLKTETCFYLNLH